MRQKCQRSGSRRKASENKRGFSTKAVHETEASFNKLVKWVSSHKMTDINKKKHPVFKSKGRIKLVATVPCLKTKDNYSVPLCI